MRRTRELGSPPCDPRAALLTIQHCPVCFRSYYGSHFCMPLGWSPAVEFAAFDGMLPDEPQKRKQGPCRTKTQRQAANELKKHERKRKSLPSDVVAKYEAARDRL